MHLLVWPSDPTAFLCYSSQYCEPTTLKHSRGSMCMCMQAAPGPVSHPCGMLCPSGIGPGSLCAVVIT